jgi:phosphoglycolate phosphatase
MGYADFNMVARLMSGIRLVVFDLDGTLVDSSTDLAHATNALIAELGGVRLPDARIAEMVGEGAAVLVRRALAAGGIDADADAALERFLVLYDECLLDHTLPYHGMIDTLERIAASRQLAVLTNKPSRATGRVLDGLGLGRFFDGVIGGDTPFGRKPDPAGLLHLARTAGASPAATLLVGDSPTDLRTARNAGARICLARYGFGYRFAEGDFLGDELFIASPGELPALLDEATTPD